MSAIAAHWPQFDATYTDDPLDLPPDRFFNRAYSWLKERTTPAEFDSWWLRANLPTPGEEPESGPWSEAEMTAAFMAAEKVL